MGKWDKSAIVLSLALIGLVVFRGIIMPFTPWWYGTIGAILIAIVLVVWKRG